MLKRAQLRSKFDMERKALVAGKKCTETVPVPFASKELPAEDDVRQEEEPYELPPHGILK